MTEVTKKRTRKHIQTDSIRLGISKIVGELKLNLFSYKFPQNLYYKILEESRFNDKDQSLPFKEINKAISGIIPDIYFINRISENSLNYVWIYSVTDKSEDIKEIIGSWIKDEIGIDDISELDEIKGLEEEILIKPSDLLGNRAWITKRLFLNHIANILANDMKIKVSSNNEERKVHFNVVQNPGSDKVRIVGNNVKPFIVENEEYYFTYFLDMFIEQYEDEEFPVIYFKPGLCRLATNKVIIKETNNWLYYLLSEKSNEGTCGKIKIIEVPVIAPFSEEGKKMKLTAPTYDKWTSKALSMIGVTLPNLDNLLNKPQEFLNKDGKSMLIRVSNSIEFDGKARMKAGLDFVNRAKLVEISNGVLQQKTGLVSELVICDIIKDKNLGLREITEQKEKTLEIAFLYYTESMKLEMEKIVSGIEDLEQFTRMLDECNIINFNKVASIKDFLDKQNIKIRFSYINYSDVGLQKLQDYKEFKEMWQINFLEKSPLNVDGVIAEIGDKDFYKYHHLFDPKSSLRNEFSKKNIVSQFFNAELKHDRNKKSKKALLSKLVICIEELLRQNEIMVYDIDSYWLERMEQMPFQEDIAYIGVKYDIKLKEYILTAIYQNKQYGKSSSIEWRGYREFLVTLGSEFRGKRKDEDLDENFLSKDILELIYSTNCSGCIVFLYNNVSKNDKRVKFIKKLEENTQLMKKISLVKVSTTDQCPEWDVVSNNSIEPSSRPKALVKYNESVFFNIAEKGIAAGSDSIEALNKGKHNQPDILYLKESAQKLEITNIQSGLSKDEIAKLSFLLRKASLQYDHFTYFPLPLHLADLAFEYYLNQDTKKQRKKVEDGDAIINEFNADSGELLDGLCYEDENGQITFLFDVEQEE